MLFFLQNLNCSVVPCIHGLARGISVKMTYLSSCFRPQLLLGRPTCCPRLCSNSRSSSTSVRSLPMVDVEGSGHLKHDCESVGTFGSTNVDSITMGGPEGANVLDSHAQDASRSVETTTGADADVDEEEDQGATSSLGARGHSYRSSPINKSSKPGEMVLNNGWRRERPMPVRLLLIGETCSRRPPCCARSV